LGGACGVCCQKVSEAEVFARGGIKDVLVSNQVRDPAKIDRLARMPKLGARTICCVDDLANVADLSAAAQKHGTEIECLVEIDCGAGRCGVTTTPAVVEIAKAIDAAEGLKFAGIQAYQGAMQHMDSYEDRKAKIDIAVAMVKDAVDTLKAEGLECDIVGGGGTGSYYFESNSGVYNELQCGSYAFMDADYGRILDKDGKRIDQGEWENALFILTSVMSHAKADKAIVRRGLKAQSVDSGLPVIFGRDDVEYVKCSDEHGVIAMDPDGVLKVNDKLRWCPAIATRPATSTTGMSACAAARSKPSGRSPRAARPTDGSAGEPPTDAHVMPANGGVALRPAIVPEREIAAPDPREAAFDAVEKPSLPPWRRAMPTTSPWCARRSAMPMRFTASRAAFDRPGWTLGLKAGGYWPHNLEKRGSSTTSPRCSCSIPTPGGVKAMVGGNLPDRAAHGGGVSVSIKHLARKDAKVLGMSARAIRRVPAARRAGTARLREGDRLEPHPEMLPASRKVAPRGRPALRGGRPDGMGARRM
jgi:3-hydroxy-D-aspartate aldolase